MHDRIVEEGVGEKEAAHTEEKSEFDQQLDPDESEGPETTTAEGPETEEPVQAVEVEPVEATSEAPQDDQVSKVLDAEGDDDEVYFEVDDYPGKQVGDLIEDDGSYYEIKGMEAVDGDNYFVGTLIPDAEEEAEESAAEAKAEPEAEETVQEAEVVPQEEPKEETPTSEAPVEETPAKEEPVAEKVEETPQEGPEAPAQAGAEEEKAADPAAGDVDKDAPVYKAIQKELKIIYGYEPDFTYAQEGGQYNVALETGESIVLTVPYINKLAEELSSLSES